MFARPSIASATQPKINLTPARGGLLQRKCACGGAPGPTGECEACRKRKQMGLQTKLKVNQPGDIYEQEADRVAEQVISTPPGPGISSALPRIQRFSGNSNGQLEAAPASVDHAVASFGRPLEPALRSDMGRRFGHDFSQVRVHSDAVAEKSARDVNAHAYTVSNHIVFGAGRFAPSTQEGRLLIAHELTHVVQQGAAPDIQRWSANERAETQVQSSEMHPGVAGHVVQRFPGDGLDAPGDCSWARYLLLRGSVETAKAVVSTLGACALGDSCIFLATKIAAITAEIVARVALNTTCFRGGDAGHRQQIQDKINMMNRCFRFFNASNCSPELIAAMAVVVERAREVIAAAAVVVAVALIVALVAAIIALAEAIAAAIAAAAAAATEAAAIAAAAAALIALLVLIRDKISPGESSGA